MSGPYSLDFLQQVVNVQFPSGWSLLGVASNQNGSENCFATFPDVAGGTPGFTFFPDGPGGAYQPTGVHTDPYTITKNDVTLGRTEAGLFMPHFSSFTIGTGFFEFFAAYLWFNTRSLPEKFRVRFTTGNIGLQVFTGTYPDNTIKAGVTTDTLRSIPPLKKFKVLGSVSINTDFLIDKKTGSITIL